LRRCDRQQRGADEHGRRAAEHAQPALPSRVVQFFEEQASPKNAEQTVGIPQREGNAEADVADGVNGKRVGDRPHASGEDGPYDQMRCLADVGANVRGAANKCRHAPAREKNSHHHDERNGDGRDVRVDEFYGSFRAAEPRSGGKAAENADGLQAAQAAAG
jgi:hypothetical protein